MITRAIIEEEILRLYEIRRNIKNELRGLDDSFLSIADTKNGIVFRRVKKAEKAYIYKGIGRKPQQVYNLAHKTYQEILLKNVECNIRTLEKLSTSLRSIEFEDIAAEFPAHYDLLDKRLIINPKALQTNTKAMGLQCNRDADSALSNLRAGNAILNPKFIHEPRPNPVGDGSVRPVTLSTDIGLTDPYEWFLTPYCENTSFPESKHHTSEWGLPTRSKNEAAILDIYRSKRRFVHYDETYSISGNTLPWKNTEMYRSPDFVSVHDDGRVVIHEHCGRKDDLYTERNREKFEIYRRVGFEQGKNLILTFDDEDGFINLELISAIIDDCFKKDIRTF